MEYYISCLTKQGLVELVMLKKMMNTALRHGYMYMYNCGSVFLKNKEGKICDCVVIRITMMTV